MAGEALAPGPPGPLIKHFPKDPVQDRYHHDAGDEEDHKKVSQDMQHANSAPIRSEQVLFKMYKRTSSQQK